MKAKAKKTEVVKGSEGLARVAELREELFNLRVQNISGSLENTSKIKQARREIARTLTLINLNKLKN